MTCSRRSSPTGSFPADTGYFCPGPATFMVNCRVKHLDAMLAQLRAAGAQVEERVEEYEYGRFGWVSDPEGNRFELWEPRRSEHRRPQLGEDLADLAQQV